MTVMIATPHARDVSPLFLDALLALEKPAEWVRSATSREFVSHARNILVARALAAPDVSHVFWLDDDMVPAPDTLTRLLAYDVPFVSGVYVYRHAPHYPAALHRVLKGDGYVPALHFRPGLQEVDAVGAGCLLVKREVFEAIAPPWFNFTSGDGSAGAGEVPRKGEDIDFCERVKAAGYPILIAGEVQCGHIAQQVVSYRDFEAYEVGRGGITVRSGNAQRDALVARMTQIRPWSRSNG